ncbi:uncharacterized protein LOC129259133 [Lytechinus pictus]|uniref:uncharacterized protein LOC129259133 n=1 Tax=Lytechinus pictus TaxID=7653 RepID=UPI0030B9F0EA
MKMETIGFHWMGHLLVAVQVLLLLHKSRLGEAQSNQDNTTTTATIPTTFDTEPLDKETTVGGFIMLQCKVSQMIKGNNYLVWTHNNKPIFEDNIPLSEDVNYNYRGVGMYPRANLLITPVQKIDHGALFSCRLYNGSVQSDGAELLMESRSAVLTVKYTPPPKYPLCSAGPQEKNGKITVVLSCCTEISSVRMSLAWIARGENASWRFTQQAKTGYETGQNCLEHDIHTGFNFSMFQCQMDEASGERTDFESKTCSISKLRSLHIYLKTLDHKNAQFNCSVNVPGRYRYLWHLRDEAKTTIQEVSGINDISTLDLRLSKVSNGSYLTCTVFNKTDLDSSNRYFMGTTETQIVHQAPPPGRGNPTMLIIGIVIGAVVGTLILGLTLYFIMVRCSRRNDRMYASLGRSSEAGMQIGPGNTYIYHKSNENGNSNGRVIATAEGGTISSEADEIPPKPGGHRTISWEPEDMVIHSNGGVINHSEDPKRRNVEGLVYADLAFKEGEEEQDAEGEGGEEEEALKGAVGGDTNGAKPGTTRESIEYASIVPPLRSLRF